MPGHDDYLDFNMWLTAQGELNRIEKKLKKPKVYAWDTSAKREQKKLEQEQMEVDFLKDVIANIPNGLSAMIYTQLSDVEEELNGFITYDREVIKLEPKEVKKILDKVHY